MMKEYTTTEECLKVNGEHAWKELPKSGISCAVYHSDGYCSWNDPVFKCYHCPARKTYTRKQAAVYGWVDERGKDIVEPVQGNVTTLNISGGANIVDGTSLLNL